MLGKAKLTAFAATAHPRRARAFYQKTLGLRLLTDDRFALAFDSNGVQLRIQKVEQVTPPPFTTLGWEVRSIRRAMTALSKSGVRFERYPFLEQNEAGVWTAPGGTQVAWFKDPDGNLLSLAESAALTSPKGAVMAENKTKATGASVERYLAAIGAEARRKDCTALARLMTKATKEPPKMWGTSIVGFGSYHYTYESGREGDSCLTGFSSRKGDISIYGAAGGPKQEALLAKLGKHKMGKGCLYIRRLSDVDLAVLEQLIAGAVAERKRRHD